MGLVSDFEKALFRHSPRRFAEWKLIDLHNHSPNSHDYRGDKNNAIDLTAEQIRKAGLSVVMFTDHETLPDPTFVREVAKKSGALILRGIELNVFVDVFNKPEGKASKNMFFHLLIGFDPEGDQTPEYWVQHIYKNCRQEDRQCANITITGVSASIDEVHSAVEASNAIIIPAHLHSDPDAFASRSIDDIYSDDVFLRYAEKYFTALEVTSLSTAQFFDGKHEETNNLSMTCIRSSDAHEPSGLGSRPSFAQMEKVTFAELKSALELPFRVALQQPEEPDAYIVGVHVDGSFLRDTWLSLSPHCNVYIGVKGSGKTSVLECLRYALGAEVPQSRQDSVRAHLEHILGANGKIEVLIKRGDGAKVIVERSLANSDFVISFDDGRKEILNSPEGLWFPTYILGWHEIEQAATDMNIRQLYLDTIAGRDKIRDLEEDASNIAKKIKHDHEIASSKYADLLGLERQFERLSGLRRGLQELTDAKLIELKGEYEAAIKHKDELEHILSKMKDAQGTSTSNLESLLPGIGRESLGEASPLAGTIAPVKDLLNEVFDEIEKFAELHEKGALGVINKIEELHDDVGTEFDRFYNKYDVELKKLSPEQRKLLETHQKVMEQTKSLPRIERERDEAKREVEEILGKLADSCDEVAQRLDERTRLRTERVSEFNTRLASYGVKLSVQSHVSSAYFSNLTNKYHKGAEIYNKLNEIAPGEHRLHKRLKRAYRELKNDLSEGRAVFFSDMEFGYFLDYFENDDLRIGFKVGREGEEYSPIDQLSAGQRCTAIFPLLLEIEDGPLVVDQPEDNLDNRHIAGSVSPALSKSKRSRQIILTSHNANLVVLSDPEHIVAFEGTGSEGWVEARGFLSCGVSEITKHVLSILDGGERALQLRLKKYGSARSL